MCVFQLVLCTLLQETEARRNIVRGRRVVNRHYLRPLGLPAWAIVVLVAIGEIVLGALAYLIMKVGIVDTPSKPRYAPAPVLPPEESQIP